MERRELKGTKANQKLQACLMMSKDLHLPGFRQRLEAVQKEPAWEQMAGIEQIYDLLKAEILRREANAAVRLRRHSNLPVDLELAHFEELYEGSDRHWDNRLMTLVREGNWMIRDTPADLIISGACGVGKSFLAGCCANFMLERKHSVYFIRAGRLFTDLQVHKINHTLERRKAELKKMVLHDFT